MTIYDISAEANGDNTSDLILTVAYDDCFTFTSDGDEDDFSIYSTDDYYSYAGTGADEIVVDFNSGLTASGSNVDFEVNTIQ